MPFNGGDVVVPNISLHELIWQRLQKHGNATAIIDASRDGKSITFKELYDSSRKVAAYLQAWGVKKGDFISICASNCLEFAYVMIGILGNGAVVAPCNPSYRKSEILQQYEISQPRIVFADEETVETMKSVKSELFCLEEIVVIGQSSDLRTLDQLLIEANSEILDTVDINPENDVAFVPHSSGTTGLPKCAVMTHKSYVASLSLGIYPDVNAPARSFYVDRPMHHMGGFGCVLVNFVSGITTVIEQEFQLEKMFKNVERYKINVISSVPSMQIEMANASNIDEYDLNSIQLIVGGGAAQSPDIIQQLIKKYKVKFMAGYGMTEISSISMGVIVEGDNSGSEGKVRKGVKVKIVDVISGEECPTGSNGEIRVRSFQVMKGYLKNPSATTEAFDRDGWFKTGDIGHLDRGGNLYVFDRLKEIIKYKSAQVSPAELETIILRHPKVADVGVVGILDEMCGEVPKAFVVPGDQTLTTADIHKIVNENLVEYKHLRGGVKFVSSIPKSTTGKIQRNMLKKMAGF